MTWGQTLSPRSHIYLHLQVGYLGLLALTAHPGRLIALNLGNYLAHTVIGSHARAS